MNDLISALRSKRMEGHLDKTPAPAPVEPKDEMQGPPGLDEIKSKLDLIIKHLGIQTEDTPEGEDEAVQMAAQEK